MQVAHLRDRNVHDCMFEVLCRWCGGMEGLIHHPSVFARMRLVRSRPVYRWSKKFSYHDDDAS